MWSQVWAVPCDLKKDCYDGSDEMACKLPSQLLPAILAGVFLMLFFSLFLHLYIQLNNALIKGENSSTV